MTATLRRMGELPVPCAHPHQERKFESEEDHCKQSLSGCEDGEPKWEPTCAVTQRSWATSGTAKRSEPPAWMTHAGLTLHSKNRVGMAGFEPAASCSQISPIPSPGVAQCRPKSHLPAITLA
jgi:hypothetical protein